MLSTQGRWADEARINAGPTYQERLDNLGNHVIVVLLPAARDAAKIASEKAQREAKEAEEKAKAEREEAELKAKEELEVSRNARLKRQLTTTGGRRGCYRCCRCRCCCRCRGCC
jgi:E3 ubiquitin-protein ligase HUWE1